VSKSLAPGITEEILVPDISTRLAISSEELLWIVEKYATDVEFEV
jgi:hypothetical protein